MYDLQFPCAVASLDHFVSGAIADGLTAAQVGAEKPGEMTEWAKALQAKQAEEAAKRAEEMAAAGAALFHTPPLCFTHQ